MKEIEIQESIQVIQKLVSLIENEKLSCTDEIRIKEIGCLMAMYTKEIEILTGEQDETFLSILDKVKRLYAPFLNGHVDSVVNYKVNLNEEGYPTRMSKSVALSCMNLLIGPAVINKEDEILKMYDQEDYILTYFSDESSLYESILDKVKQLYSPLIKAGNAIECSDETCLQII